MRQNEMGSYRHLTADKREIKDFAKLRLRNFFYPQAVGRNFIRTIWTTKTRDI